MGRATNIGRLKRRGDFLMAARGRKSGGPVVGLQGRRRDDNEPLDQSIRIGFTCSKKVGNAVARNRARRRLKAAASQIASDLAIPGCDYVLIGRAATVDAPFGQIMGDLRRAFEEVGKRLEGK
ncbi:MAG: ribonuclease P protein component [Rhodospirillales bacterium]|jgi:ribonuclease P protein component